MGKSVRRLLVTLGVTGTVAAFLASVAFAASPAAFTTNSTGSQVDGNHYANKCDVYLNGGPNNAALPSGSYVFFVLAPGGQADPNGSSLLSTDSNANRTFSSNGSGTITYGGTHPTGTDSVTGTTLIDLCDTTYSSDGYNNTPNSGGVYILAICPESNQTPSGCKYDAFKVAGTENGTDLSAIKTAVGSYVCTHSWTTTKSVTPTYVQTNNDTVQATYAVGYTKSACVNSGFEVDGTVTVFNTNANTVTGVSVADAIGTTNCTVTGGSSSIAGGGQAVFSYTCPLTGVDATSTGSNTATITWNATSITSPNSSTTASAAWDFTAPPTVVGNCTTVTDTLAPTQVTGTICDSQTFNYVLTLNVPASGCTTYSNTASETTSGTSASASVELCRTNSGGFTIGYWQNKNGQAYIAAHAAALCTYLKTYSNILSGLPDCSGANIAKDYTKVGSLDKYVYDTIKAANSAGDGLLMLKAQFLATAINVFQTSSLGTTNIVLSSSQQSELALSGCSSVNSVLSAENSRYSTYSGTKSKVVDLQNLDNNINNNNQLTC